MYTILVCDDEQDIVSALEIYLTAEGYRVLKAYNGKEALAVAAREEVHLILMDIMMPVMDGLTAMAQLRQTSNVPVILLTAKSEDTDKVLGLNVGADDYITKPFRIRELVSRIKTVLRRCGKGKDDSFLEVGPIRINTAQAKVYKADREILLTALEYRLLLILATNGGQVLSRSQILEGIWDVGSDFVNDNTLTVYIKRLREKIEDNPQNPEIIRTVRGLGYQMAEVRI